MIRGIISTLYILLIGLIVGNSNNPVNDLRRKPTREDYLRTLNCWTEKNFYFICLAAILFLLIIFCIVCFMIVGVSATESGLVYNAWERII